MIPKFNIKDMKLTKRWIDKVKDKKIKQKMIDDKMENMVYYDESSPSFYNSNWSTTSGTYGPTINEGEIKCPSCQGIGFKLGYMNTMNPAAFIKPCKSCHGYGKLDWCSKVTAGVKE